MSRAIALLLLAACCAEAAGDDWPQWRGPRRDGTTAEPLALERWPAGGAAPVAWRAEVGRGHSAVSVVGDRAYVLGWDGAEESLVCLDVATGETHWRRSWPCETIVQWPGPRATPTVADGTVYTLGTWGRLAARDAASGELRWERDLDRAMNPDVDYGFASSPWAVGELLLLSYGPRGLAVRRSDGAVVRGGEGKGACTSPVPLPGSRAAAVVVFTPEERNGVELVGVEVASGAELWRSPLWPEQWGAVCVDPVVRGGQVFVTSGEQYKRSARFTVADGTLREDWSTGRLSGYTGAAVLVGETLYLVDGNGVLKAVDWETGETRWSAREYDPHGSLIAAGDRLLVQTGRSGELAVVAADPAAHRELRRMQVFAGDDPTSFTAPVLANGRIYVRSYQGEVVCLDLSSE